MSQKKLERDFWGRGQNPKVCKTKNLKNILNNVIPNSKAQATATFSISALISEILAFKAKRYWYFGIKGPNKKSLLHKSFKKCFLVFSDDQFFFI